MPDLAGVGQVAHPSQATVASGRGEQLAFGEVGIDGVGDRALGATEHCRD